MQRVTENQDKNMPGADKAPRDTLEKRAQAIQHVQQRNDHPQEP